MTTATLNEQVFRLPDLGEGLTDAEIVEWKVAVGDTVTIDQTVVEVETAKAAVEVPVPYAGTVLRLHAEAGTPLGVGEPLITVGAAAPAVPVPAVPDTAAEQYREEEQAGSGNVLIGYGTGHEPAPRRRRRGTTAAPQAPAPAPVTQAHAPRVISPLVRRLARDHGIDLAALAPSGPAGVVLRRDVEQAVARQAPAAAEPAPAPASDGPVRIPLRGIRKAVADKLSRSRTEIPDATTWVDVDATGLLQAKGRWRPPNPADASACWPCSPASVWPVCAATRNSTRPSTPSAARSCASTRCTWASPPRPTAASSSPWSATPTASRRSNWPRNSPG